MSSTGKTGIGTESLFEYKVVHTLNFKCTLCNKRCTTEATMKKHLRIQHDDIKDPSQLHYSCYNAYKRVKVPVQTNPSQDSKVTNLRLNLANPELAYKCSICEKYFRSIFGVDSHLLIAHNVKSEMASAAYSVRFVPKTSASRGFVPPTKKVRFASSDKVMTQKSTDHQLAVCEFVNDKEQSPAFPKEQPAIEPEQIVPSEQSEAFPAERPPGLQQEQTPALHPEQTLAPHPEQTQALHQKQTQVFPTEQSPAFHTKNNIPPQTSQRIPASNKKQQVKPKTRLKQVKSVLKKKTIGFCRNISNMFTNGTLPIDKLWSKPNASNNNLQSQMKNPMNQNIRAERKHNENLPQKSPVLFIEEAPATTPSPTSASPKTAQYPGPYGPVTTPPPGPSGPVTTPSPGPSGSVTTPSPGPSGSVMTPSPGPSGSVMTSSPGPSGSVMTPSPGLPRACRAGVSRRRKTCRDKDCKPCSMSSDCMKCRYCVNKNLK